ncbi:amidophosphoribosyltransferase [Thermosulfidibacter takaii ABI70S6]|uniref:Amidophosphoribosyltransferase n=1 Tax=Thermosulfidibacter takaii (strain DSM 17441 / JCM 13301 / NBRC 103674 / ABI70S6) TaxID=1298851 RepID=A0A0S3QTS1_THET7|nr:amidophosphoribosyltransferase [Thermosulfidibacter takaii]BAT71726.1 amidophosphoribosyltransferase [Thermosulfidibacter takaii ABI70S6]
MHFWNEKCGIAGVYGHPEAAKLVYLCLYALQHRGQESAGIAAWNGKEIHLVKKMGLVADIFDESALEFLQGPVAIGHNRYSTTGESTLKNAQPLFVNFKYGELAVAHNGNLVNAQIIREKLESEGAIFQSNMDTEVLVHLISRAPYNNFRDSLNYALRQLKGAFSLLLLREDELIAVRDPWGIRPLVLGMLKDAYVVASETCALDLIDAVYVRDIKPGEVLRISKSKVESWFPFEEESLHHCIFEYIYFARPDSIVFGKEVYGIRYNFGKALARESTCDADIVIPVPDSGIVAALGFAKESGISFELGLIRNHYVGRTFIEPKDSVRHFGVRVKLNPVKEVLSGKRVIVIDDSIVRGTTSMKIVKMIRAAGAKEVHMKISSPPITHSCFYGIDTPTRRELIASSHSVEEICKYITADSLQYLSLEGMIGSAGYTIDNHPFCLACFTGDYPVRA